MVVNGANGLVISFRANHAQRAASTFNTEGERRRCRLSKALSSMSPPYASDRDYLFALADELRKENELLFSRGHVLQLDAPDLALERQIMFVDQPLEAFPPWVS